MEFLRLKQMFGLSEFFYGKSCQWVTCLIQVIEIRLFMTIYSCILLCHGIKGRGNQEVMQFVTGGGRLSSPNSSTPSQVYSLMQECWNLIPDNRPSFAAIVERIGSFLVDQQILETPLPLFSRVPSEDTTLMRPPPGSDYLVPTNPSPTYSLSSEKTELLSPDTCSTVTNDDTKLLELLDDAQSGSGSGIQHNSSSWKKSSIPQSIKESESGISSEGTSAPSEENQKTKPTRYVNV